MSHNMTACCKPLSIGAFIKNSAPKSKHEMYRISCPVNQVQSFAEFPATRAVSVQSPSPFSRIRDQPHFSPTPRRARILPPFRSKASQALRGSHLHVAGGPGVVALWRGIMHRKAGQAQVVWSSPASMPARSVRRFFCLQPGKRQATEWPLFPERDPHAGKS